MERLIINMPTNWQQSERLRQRPLKTIQIDVPEYSPRWGVVPVYSDTDYLLDVQVNESNHEVMITADTEGLIVLARHFLTLALESVPSGCHIHYDDNPSSGLLSKGSLPMVVSKV